MHFLTLILFYISDKQIQVVQGVEGVDKGLEPGCLVWMVNTHIFYQLSLCQYLSHNNISLINLKIKFIYYNEIWYISCIPDSQ